jgi:hypothetical protein
MSHIPQQRRAAHIRHANRAGGFGGLGDFFTDFPTDRPGFGTDFPVPTHKHAGQDTSIVASVPLSIPSSGSDALSTSSATPTSSSIPTSSSVQTTSSSPSPTSTTPSITPTTTFSATALHDNLTKVITHLVSASTTAFPAASSSVTPRPSNALVAPVVGGVAGGIAGLALVIFLVTFCMRRRRNKDETAVNFDPGSFRRSAMLIADPPTHQDTVARGYNPPAPPMMERSQMYPDHSNYSTSPVGLSPTSGNPLYPSTFSPIASPNPASPVSAYDHSWGTPAPILTRNTSASSSSSAHGPAQYGQYPSLPSPGNALSIPQNEEYLDLERNSVTPFQAAQYVEISKRLNTEVPKGLDTPAVEEFVDKKMPAKDKDEDLPPLPPKNPFADATAEDDDDENTLPMVQEFPSPPSPVHTTASRYRVDSTPPTLPEIVVQPRVSVTSAYLSQNSSPAVPGFPAGQTIYMKSPFAESPITSRFPVTPSPLASSFDVPTPPAAQTSFPAAPAAAQPRPNAKQRQSVYTVYDPEDAYGGI